MGLTGGRRLALLSAIAVIVVLTVGTIAALVVNANPGSPAAASNPSSCAAPQLAVTLGSPQGAAGSIAQTVHFENVSSARCTLEGYPALLMLGAAGTPLATEEHRGPSVTVPSIAPRLVTLAPGAKASFDIGYSDATGYANERCPTSARVAIIPPEDTKPITIAWRLEPYGGDIPHLRCGEIAVSPVYPG
jgi:hypothetical protein